jgi:hypothetical protein
MNQMALEATFLSDLLSERDYHVSGNGADREGLPDLIHRVLRLAMVEIALSQLPGLLPSARGRDCSGR